MPRLLHHISARYRSGNYIPESALELGCTFPIEPHGKLRPTWGALFND